MMTSTTAAPRVGGDLPRSKLCLEIVHRLIRCPRGAARFVGLDLKDQFSRVSEIGKGKDDHVVVGVQLRNARQSSLRCTTIAPVANDVYSVA